MIIVNPTPGSSSGGGAIRSVHIPPFVKFSDNKALGMSQDDSANDAQGSLYPTNLNTSLTAQSQITQLFSTDALKYYAIDDDQYDVAESKIKIAEQFFSKFKELSYIAYGSFTALPKTLPNTIAYFQNVFKVDWLSSTRVAVLYMDNLSGWVLKVVVGQLGGDGYITWGTPAVAKTYTDATHANYAGASMTLTDTDKLLVTYTNKVSTSYYLKARIMAVSGTSVTPQSEGADNTNYGTSGPYQLQAVRIRSGSGAGAVALAVPATSGTSTVTKIQIISHDNANAITYGGATVSTPTVNAGNPSSVGGINLYSYATDRLIVADKYSGTTHVYAQVYTISGVTVTAVGTPLQLTGSTSSQHYMTNRGHNGFCSFGGNDLGFIMGPSAQPYRVILFNVASDVLTMTDDGSSDNSQAQSNTTYGTPIIVNSANNKALFFGQVNSSGSKLATWEVSKVGNKAVVQSYQLSYHDLVNLNDPAYVWPGSSKTLYLDSNTNASQTMKYQVGAGDTVIQILNSANTVLATITESGEIGGNTKLKKLALAIANTARLIFKVKNNSAEARIIKIETVFAKVE